MTRNEVLAEIRVGLGFRSEDIDDKIIRKMQSAQEALEGGHSLPWFICHEDSGVNLIEGQAEYDLAPAFIREADDLGFFNTAQSRMGDIYHVRKMQYDKAIAYYGFTSTGYPAVYSLRASKIRIFPIPDAEYNYRWHFYQRQVSLIGSGDITEDDNAWLANVPQLIEGMAGVWMAQNLRDADAVAYFASKEQYWKDWLHREIEERKGANEVVVMGSDR
jgi:hypothetical protein